jgi:hypothetical protein
MKTPKIALACLTLLLGGCILVPSPYSGQLNPVADRYSSIKKGTSRSELETQLGKPSREEKEGSCVWETRFDELNYAVLKVWFDSEGKAQKVETTRAHGKNTAGHQSSAVITRTK